MLEGLTLTVIGLVVAFAFMALFILTIVVLKALFPAKSTQTPTAAETDLPASAPMVFPDSSQPEEEAEIVAAIATAVAYVRSQTQNSLGNALAQGRGAWWMANQINAPQDSGLNRR
jgi:sodium pump decarboxylase gamma subunit